MVRRNPVERIAGKPRVRPAGQGAHLPQINMPNSMDVSGTPRGVRGKLPKRIR